MQISKSITGVSFGSILEEAQSTVNRTFALDTSKKTVTSRPYSVEADYPRLTSEDLLSLMPSIDAAISKASAEYGINENLIRSIIKVESSFQPFSLSISGAMGLMQLMPETAKWMSVTNPYDIDQNISGGTRYFRDQLARFDGDIELALAAYNKGPNAVKSNGGVPEEARAYVQRVLKYYQMYNSSQY